MIRAVFDTMIFVKSLMNPSGFWGHVVFDRVGSYDLLVSEPISVEIIEVIQRPEFVRKYPELATRNPYIIALLAGAHWVHVAAVPPVRRDPKDDKFLATALAGNEDYVVIKDQDLLVLGEYEGRSRLFPPWRSCVCLT